MHNKKEKQHFTQSAPPAHEQQTDRCGVHRSNCRDAVVLRLLFVRRWHALSKMLLFLFVVHAP